MKNGYLLLSSVFFLGTSSQVQAKLKEKIEEKFAQVKETIKDRRDRRAFIRDVRAENLFEIKRDVEDNPDVLNDTTLFGGRTALHIIAHKEAQVLKKNEDNLTAIVAYLLEKGANPNVLDRPAFGGATPLYYAALKGHKGIVEQLLLKGANPNLTGRDGFTPLHQSAVTSRADADLDIATMLLVRKANVNAKDKNGRTPLDVVPKQSPIAPKADQMRALLQSAGGKKGSEL